MEEPKKDAVLSAFDELWKELFSSRVHLDSALSRRPARFKSILARIVPRILLRPTSLAEVLGVGMAPGEPWSLSSAERANWRPARVIAERLYEAITSGAARMPEAPPIREDYSPALIQEWESSFGTKVTDELVEILALEPPLSLRAVRRIGGAKLLKALASDGSGLPVPAALSDLAPFGVRLGGYAPILGNSLYDEGGFEIQDEGSQLMAAFALWPERVGFMLREKPGRIAAGGRSIEVPERSPAWNVVDACAGAGGKSLALADLMAGKGRLYAYDTSAVKLQALRRRATRARVTNIQAVTIKEGQEVEVTARFKRRAQAVLVDAPCSGWGVLRRNPDAKWRQEPDGLERMPLIQSRLLARYAELVAPGGKLTYGVCTFRRAETRDIVADFLRKHPEFEAREGGYLGPGPCDGFFMQSFERRAKGEARQ